MFIEIKTHCATRTSSQQDTQNVIDNALGNLLHKTWVDTKRSRKLCYYHGLHVACFSNTRPDNSEWMTWNGKRITVEELMEVLAFKRDARTLKKRYDRGHHKSKNDLLLFENALKP